MTTCLVQASGTIELYFYGELAPLARAEAARHLAVCAECRRVLEELELIRAALAERPDVSAPPGGDWSGFMARLDRAVRSGTPDASRPAVPGRARRLSAGWMAMAALLALVSLSVAQVIRSRAALSVDPAVSSAGAAGETGTAPAAVPAAPGWTADAAFESLSEQHFARSKLVVLGLASKDPEDAGAREWAYERDLASELLGDTRLYRFAAEQRGMTSLASVMEDLELVLLQASMSRNPEPAELEQIQSLIRKRDLVTKMNVMNVAGM